MQDILAVQVHYGWNKRMGGALSPKIVLDSKKPLKKILQSLIPTWDGFTNWINAKMIPFSPPSQKRQTPTSPCMPQHDQRMAKEN